MRQQSIPVVHLSDYQAGGQRRQAFVELVGASLADIGFFAVDDHSIPSELVESAYRVATAFFAHAPSLKNTYRLAGAHGQRGFTGPGTERAKDAQVSDLKEFFQIGRVDVPPEHEVHRRYGPNVWPTELVPEFEAVIGELYRRLDSLGALLLEACALYIGEPVDRFRSLCSEADTILRVLHYPPIPEGSDPRAVRSAAHEDINLITLLSGATADGLQLLRRDGSWLPIEAHSEQVVVDAGDMLQNITNGFYRSTTHRVVNPDDSGTTRFSMPCFIHPRRDADLTPLASCVGRTGGQVAYPSITAGDYLAQRLREIGLEVGDADPDTDADARATP